MRDERVEKNSLDDRRIRSGMRTIKSKSSQLRKPDRTDSILTVGEEEREREREKEREREREKKSKRERERE